MLIHLPCMSFILYDSDTEKGKPLLPRRKWTLKGYALTKVLQDRL